MTNTTKLDPSTFAYQAQGADKDMYLGVSEVDAEGFAYFAYGVKVYDFNDDSREFDYTVYWQDIVRARLQVEPLAQSLHHVTDLPHTWNQGSWFSAFEEARAPLAPESPALECGTAGCLAGTISMQAGGRPVRLAAHWSWHSVVVPADLALRLGERQEADRFAERVLFPDLAPQGKERMRAVLHVLWNGSNRLGDLWALGWALSSGRLVPPDASVIARAQAVADRYWGK